MKTLYKLLFIFLYFLVFINPVPVNASPQTEGEVVKTEVSVVINGRIRKLQMVKNDDGFMISDDDFIAVLDDMDIQNEYDQITRLLTLSIEPPAKEPSFIPASTDPFIIVFNGKINKTFCLVKGGLILIPFETLKNIVIASGAIVEIDAQADILSIHRNEESKVSKIKHQGDSNSALDETPVVSENLDGNLDGKVKDIGTFMDSLRSVFQKNKPDQQELSKFMMAALHPDKKIIQPADFEKLIKGYDQIIGQINQLIPPDKETEEIQRDAVSVFNRMKTITSLAMEVINTEKGYSKPEAIEKILKEFENIEREATEFNKKVKKVREKYNLGNP